MRTDLSRRSGSAWPAEVSEVQSASATASSRADRARSVARPARGWGFEKLVLDVPSDEHRRRHERHVATDAGPDRDPTARRHSEGEATENHAEVYLAEQVVAVFIDDDRCSSATCRAAPARSGWGRRRIAPASGQRAGHRADQARRDRRCRSTPGGVYSSTALVEALARAPSAPSGDPAYFNDGSPSTGRSTCRRIPPRTAASAAVEVGETFRGTSPRRPVFGDGEHDAAQEAADADLQPAQSPTTPRRRRRPSSATSAAVG